MLPIVQVILACAGVWGVAKIYEDGKRIEKLENKINFRFKKARKIIKKLIRKYKNNTPKI